MDKFLAILAGLLFGIGQFFILWRTLKPLTKGESPQIALGMLLKLPLPLALLVACALIDTALLPFAGIAFCAGLMAASVANHMINTKRRG